MLPENTKIMNLKGVSATVSLLNELTIANYILLPTDKCGPTRLQGNFYLQQKKTTAEHHNCFKCREQLIMKFLAPMVTLTIQLLYLQFRKRYGRRR